jgi:uncharacterized membrane protein (UPF0127 family)
MVMKKNTKIFLALIILITIMVLGFLSLGYAYTSNNIIKLEKLESDKQKIKGLSGRESLCDNCGMLFRYEKPQEIGIWMKNMNFSIDIIWLDTEKKITHIEQSVSPKTYPKSFSDGSGRSKYVIELPSGYVKEKELQQNDKFYFW